MSKLIEYGKKLKLPYVQSNSETLISEAVIVNIVVAFLKI